MQKKENFLLGGETFDVTILSIDGNLLEVRASKGDCI